MDLNYVVAERIAFHLPRELRYVETINARHHDSKYHTYTYVDVYVNGKRAPLDTVKTLRLVHSAFADLFNIVDLCRKQHVYLFREQYSAIMLGNHVFDMRWTAFPADRDSKVYAEYSEHADTHSGHTITHLFRLPKDDCVYCDVEHQRTIELWRRQEPPRKFAGDHMWDIINARNLGYPSVKQHVNYAAFSLLKAAHDYRSILAIPRAISQGTRINLNRDINERIESELHSVDTIQQEYSVQQTYTIRRRATAADLGIQTRRQSKRSKRT